MKLESSKSLNGMEKSLFYKEYSFIRQQLPRRIKWSRKINKLIMESVVERVKNNSGYYFNNLFINFIEENRDKKTDDLTAYDKAFTYKTLTDQYSVLLDFFDYYMENSPKGNYILCELECEVDTLPFSLYGLSEKYKLYKNLKKNITYYGEFNYRALYSNIIKLLAVYFIINNDLLHNDYLYGEICRYLYDNQDFLLDYYKINYYVNQDMSEYERIDMYINIVNNLVSRYNNQKGNNYAYTKSIY